MKIIGKKYRANFLGEMNNVATFYNYREDKVFWFVIYLELAAAICEHPYLSVKNSDFKDNMGKLNFPIETEREILTSYGTK